MKLANIEAAGFRGIRTTISVPVTDGFLIVNGPNGSGKSTVFDAIEFALTGRISRPALASEGGEDINDYIWWRGSGELPERFVRLCFSDDTGHTVQIIRRPIGPSFSRVSPDGRSEDLDESAFLDLFADETAPRDDLLERLCARTIIRDEQITELSVDAPERERFALVQDTLGSTQLPDIENRLKKAKQTLDVRVRRLESNYEQMRAEVNHLLSRISEARSELKSQPDSEQAWRDLVAAMDLVGDVETDELIRQARSRVGRLHLIISTLSRCLPRLADIERRRVEIKTEDYRRREKELATVLQRADEAARVAQARCEAAQRAAAEFETRQSLIRSLAELVEHGRRVGLENDRCPLCGSEVSSESFEAHLRATSERVNREAEGLSGAVQEREAALATEREANSTRRAAEVALRSFRRGAEDLVAEYEEVSREVRLLEEFQAKADLSAEAVGARLDQGLSELTKIESPLAAIEVSSAYDRLIEEERSLSQARDKLASIEKSLETARRALAYADEASRVVRRVAGELVDERLAQLEPLLLELYERIRPHPQWSTVGYKIRGDVRRFLRLTVGDSELNPRFMFSSGQRRALGLAFLLSAHISTTWSRWNSLILDDPMQHVDDYRALHLAEVLSAIRKDGRQVLCAVEDAALADLLARRLATSESEQGSIVRLKYELGDGSTIVGIEALPRMAPHLITAA